MPNLVQVLKQLSKRFTLRWLIPNRKWQFIALAVFSAGVVSGCNGAFSGNSEQYISANVHPDQLTHTVDHAMDITQVPKDPQRIVALESFTAESLLAIDLLPIGVPTPQDAYLQKQLQNTESVGSPPDLEQVLDLQPDLILGTTYRKEIYTQASQIAPTVLFELESSADWKEIFVSVGKALNRLEAVEEVMSQYEARLERLQEKLRDRANTLEISVVRVYPDRFELYQQNTFVGTILADAGLSRPPSQRGDQFSKSISKEQLPLADGDVIFVWTYGENSNNIWEKLQADPLWSQLEAVQQEKVYQVNGSYWIGSGLIAANLVIDDLFRYLLEEKS